MSPAVTAALIVFVPMMLLVMFLCWRLSKVHYELSDAYSTISRMVIANHQGKPAEVERLAEEHADAYNIGHR